MNESTNDTTEISQMDCQEIANEVRTKFNYDFSTKVKWGQLKYDSKIDMAQFAEGLLLTKGYKTNHLVTVFKELNIDASEGNRPNVLNTSLAKSLRRRRNGTLPRKKSVNKPIIQSNDFLSNLMNSDDDKMGWIKSTLTGPKDPKYKSRGGAFYGTDRRGINKYMLFQRCHNNCPYCDSELDYGANPYKRGFNSKIKEHTKHRPSLDRINPEIGYIDTNVQVICNHCNTLKNNATVDEIVQLAEAMKRQYRMLKASGLV